MHGRRGRVERNADGRDFGIVRLQETHPLAVHADAPRHQVGGQRQGVAVALLDARDLAVALQSRQQVFQLSLAIAPKAELRPNARGIERCVTCPAKQAQNLIFHIR